MLNDGMHVYRNEITDWFVAKSPEEAATLAKAYYEESQLDPSEMDLKFTQEPDDKSVNVYNEDGEVVKTTYGEWCSSEPKGFLCSTEY